MANFILTLEGKHFKRQYLLYVIEITHGNEKYYYVGQTGDNHYLTARPAFRRLAGHLADDGGSTENQVYRYLASEVLGFPEVAKTGSSINARVRQAVENYMVDSTVKMFVYPLQPFEPGITNEQHKKIVQNVRLFEKWVINHFRTNSKRIANKNTALPPKDVECPYQEILNQIIDDFF
jgi:hypothetical protein